ncbi:flagellar biosynthetic protein FliR [Spongiibacter sp. KMU-158]|uniref:Flagellar biosynthetic protein FliR n=1 Tax=Spongiibacter pelagi TaxID=2760804 RepID=A0A927C0G3_9GAMM|nr:flagellar biosynthetic protein FliR [Spongiibacter pelagi]MBD2858444.1 flagellar biosynthetic protein FliR [Spongiibacter pelagi]
MTFTEAQIMAWLASAWLPFVRIGGAMMTAPLFSGNTIPRRVRLMVALFVTAAVLPVLPPLPAINLLGFQAILMAASELVIGLAMGFIIQLVFDGIILGGQLIANGMGLGFAMMVDPQRGIQVPVLSQYLLILIMLLFVCLNGHLDFLNLLIRSFEYWPIGRAPFSADQMWAVAAHGTDLFAAAVRVAIPAIIALLVVQLAVGVVSRAAPTLNLFAVGFPLAMLVGFLVVDQLVPNLLPVLQAMLDSASFTVQGLLGR